MDRVLIGAALAAAVIGAVYVYRSRSSAPRDGEEEYLARFGDRNRDNAMPPNKCKTVFVGTPVGEVDAMRQWCAAHNRDGAAEFAFCCTCMDVC